MSSAVGVDAATSAPFSNGPDLVLSAPQYATGSALADLDGDGWLDWVISGGNDMASAPVVIFYNDGQGGYPSTPSWTSPDSDYHGHLALADVDGDGKRDLLVTILGPDPGPVSSPAAKLYLGSGAAFAQAAAWSPNGSGRAFGCAVGDVDGDGKLDLALAGAWPYDRSQCSPTAVFLSGNASGGAPWPAVPSWTAPDRCDWDVAFADVDNDGALDLVAAGDDTAVYFGAGGTLEQVAEWRSALGGAPQVADRVLVADLNRDGWLDLVVSDNDQLHPTSPGGNLFYPGPLKRGQSALAAWRQDQRYASALGAGIVSGQMTLATGQWWGPLRLFGVDASGALTPIWSSTDSIVAEALTLTDVNQDGRNDLLVTNWNGGAEIFYGRP
jgi:hypothetical protein